MAIFAYDPSGAKTWSTKVVQFLNGGSESINACSVKFSEQIEKLVQPNVWTGAAAKKNYQNFMETHEALIQFVNSFGNAFQQAMTSVNESVANLEVSNLGTDTNVKSSFGSLTYDQLKDLSEQNIGTDIVTYDYATISGIGSALASIKSTLESINSSLKQQINLLNDGSKMWDGDSAESAKGSLLNVLSTNMTKVLDSLNVCINNISTAADAAQHADTAA